LTVRVGADIAGVAVLSLHGAALVLRHAADPVVVVGAKGARRQGVAVGVGVALVGHPVAVIVLTVAHLFLPRGNRRIPVVAIN
jgi:hypothetical protein